MSNLVSQHEMPTDPIGGKPPAGSTPSVADLDYQVNYQQARLCSGQCWNTSWEMPDVELLD